MRWSKPFPAVKSLQPSPCESHETRVPQLPILGPGIPAQPKPFNRHLIWLILIVTTAFSAVRVTAQAPPAPAAPAARFVVVLNAAHGGDDAGANLDGQPEKAFTLAMSIRLRSLLAARGISVVTTRESDVTVDAIRRAEIADHANAQACLTLHASETGVGVHLFTSSLALARPALFEPWKTAQAAWITRSVALEGVLNSALQHAGLAVTLGRTALPVVDSMTCPAVAVEIAPGKQSGGVSGPSVPGSLADPDYQAQIANALTAALLEWQSEGPKL
jgi:N-acetylmuramoyl-L-alanine amidase